MLASQAGNIQSGNEEVLFTFRFLREWVEGFGIWGDVKKINNDLSTEQMGPLPAGFSVDNSINSRGGKLNVCRIRCFKFRTGLWKVI